MSDTRAYYLANKLRYPWLTHSFLDHIRYQLSLALLKRGPHTQIRFVQGKILQVYFGGTIYDIDKLRADPFKFVRILDQIWQAAPWAVVEPATFYFKREGDTHYG